MNHQYAGESVIELYVVKNSGKVKLTLNMITQTANICQDITSLPKVYAGR
jgi:hypothetical protein